MKKTIKVYRYMSKTEFEKMMKGETIKGKEYHSAKTNSTGVCFLPEEVIFRAASGRRRVFDAVECYDFLMGIVSDEILVEFETEKIKKTYGVYADPTTTFFGDDIIICERCTASYDTKTFKPLRYATDFDENYDYGIGGLNWTKIER